MNNKTKFTFAILGSSLLTALLALGLFIGYNKMVSTDGNASVAEVADSHVFKGNLQQVALRGGQPPQDFVEAAESTVHGVVNIRAEITRGGSESRRAPQEFFDPFELFFGQRGFGAPRQPRNSISIGSGVIISTDGYIITNNHVINGASKITISLNSNREYEARIIGTDKATDLALLKIDAKDLPVIPFGDSEALRVGEWVLAVGNPFGLSSTVTAGIVSAKGRSDEIRGSSPDGSLQIASFIQTDAAVNPGNSGGALVNTKGELIGINTMIYSQTGNYAGYSFAIPVSIASKVVADLKQFGAVQRAVLGIVGQSVTNSLIEEHNLKVSKGAFVTDFGELSAAKMAGVEKEDVITAVNGIKIRSMGELQEQISKYRPGDRVGLAVDRKGKKLEFNIDLTNAKGNTEIIRSSGFHSLGAAFKELSQEKMERFGLSYGVEIAGLDDGRLKDAGLQKGFIILAINNVIVRTPQDVESIVNEVLSSSADKVLFIKGLTPNGRIKYLAVDLS